MVRRNSRFARLETDWGIHLGDGAVDFLPAKYKDDYDLAMDAQPTLITTSNSGVPAYLTTFVEPSLINVLLAPNKMAEIIGETRKGSWLDQTIMFTVVEHTGEVSNYGDRNMNGRAGVNMNFPQRQALLYQTLLEWGELEMERAGLARIGWAAEVKEAGVVALNKFQNLTYAYGVSGLANYGLLNDPALSASLTPGVKAAGGNQWITLGQITATANEIFEDFQSVFVQLTNQTAGLVETDDELVLAMSPASAVALTATNSFNVNVYDLLKKNFPKIRFETAVQYGAKSATNPEGIAAGNLMQLIAPRIGGQETGFCAFNEKLRNHPVIRYESSFRQKITQGTWGTVLRMPMGVAQMIGL